MLPHSKKFLVVAACKVTIVHLAIQPCKLKVCVRQIWWKIILKNLPLITENLLPPVSGKIPVFLRVIGAGQTDVRDKIGVFLSRSHEEISCLGRGRFRTSQPDLSF